MMIVKPVPSLIFPSVFTFLSLNLQQGANADSTCPKNCMPYLGDIHCNKTNGVCLAGCNKGFYGNTCECTCPCGGEACVREDGTCMQTSSAKPVQVCKEQQQAEDCQTGGYITGISVLCVIVLLLIAVISILVFKFKRLCQRSKKQQSKGPEDLPLMPEISPSQPPESVPQIVEEQPVHDLGLSMLPDMKPSQPLEPMPKTVEEQLVHELGVYVLDNPNQPNKPVFLYCVHMKYDYRRVNTLTTHIDRDRYLVNKPEMKSKVDQFSERFNEFSGTTSLSPTIHGDLPTYWEVHANVELNNELQPTTLLLCIGFCREMERNSDEWFQTPHKPNCYNLNVGMCPRHGQICTKIYRGEKVDPVSDIQTDIENKEGEYGNLRYGFLVYKGKKVIVYFDLTKMEHIASLESIDFERPLWPMFGVFKRSNPYVRMKLVTGRDIDMSQNKKVMILKALLSVKCDQ